MRNFLLGVAVGAIGMGFYTGHIKLLDGDGKPLYPTEKAESAKEKVETAASSVTDDQKTAEYPTEPLS